MSDELVEVVDEDGDVVALVSRSQMRAENLRHRGVGILLRTTDGDVVVHRRAEWKDVWPGYWDVAFGGVLAQGEDWLEGAHRELREEAGIDVDELTEVNRGTYEDDHVRIAGRLYLAVHDGPFTFVDGEVVETALVPWGELRAWIAQRTCCPDSLASVLPLLPE